MTARPIVTEHRWPAITVVALVLMLVMAMAAGCTAPVQDTPATPAISPTPTAPLTDRELAEKSIADARAQIEKTDAVIGWFRGNTSTRDDPQLQVIMTKREVAYSYVVTAEDELAQGNYEQALEKAQDAFTKANESYTDALQHQRNIFHVSDECGKNQFLDIVIIFILVILCSFLPALLAAFTYSLFRTNIVPAAGQIRTYASRITDEYVFTGALVTFSAILFIGVVTKQIFHPRLPLSGTTITITTFWAGLVILTAVVSVVIVAMVAAGLIGAHLKAGRKGSWPDGGAQAPQGRNMQALYEILAVILLLILVYFSVMVALTIRGPFVMRM